MKIKFKITKTILPVLLLLFLGCTTKNKTFKYGKVKQLKTGFKFTEGPIADGKGNIYFTDQPNNKIYVYDSKTDSLKLFLQPTERANGLYFDKQGNLLACADEFGKIISIDKNKNYKVLVQNFDGKQFNGPNDLWVAPNGGIYFTDPYYQRPYWKRTKPDLPTEDVYYLSPKGKLSKAAGNFVKPNGIIGTVDGKYLYVADIGASKTYRYQISYNGSLTNKTLFCNEGSDGMTIDKNGNVYITNEFVSVFNKSGKNIAKIKIPEIPSNVTFYGPDKKELFITARTSIYKVTIE